MSTENSQTKDYNQTISLPKTDFPMKANLAGREPGMLEDFKRRGIYKKLIAKNAGKPLFILHDGPPFSNGDIHIGHVMNKSIKDAIVRYKNMAGFQSPYVPGWDNHGMPIETAIIKKNKLDRKKMTIPEFRRACHAFAQDFVERQRVQFQRLGVIGEWDNPYLTMDPKFEAREVEVFGEMYRRGYIYKGLKPVYWCPNDETALAEAEIEYADVPGTALFVEFPVTDGRGVVPESASFVIWTTTAWTIPGNLAISVNPALEYAVAAGSNGKTYVVAASLVKSVAEKAGISLKIEKTVSGKALEGIITQHPLAEIDDTYRRPSPIICGFHVTEESGTGCVHTAPGFGADDFTVCAEYGIKPFVPVAGNGVLTEETGKYAGQHYSKAGDVIIEDLQSAGRLLASEEITHSYPHCWRCKKPIIFRATEQWFCSAAALKDTAIAECDGIDWYPKWGKERMIAMIRERSDWCISRQRHWGLPIPVFYCDDCGKPVCTDETVAAVSALFSENGSNAWFEKNAAEILPKGFVCPHCGGAHFTQETDTLDGWFDSGSSHAAVLKERGYLQYPADIYLEGGDQFRGWFQSSMLTSVATNGIAPYREIITHGWTVDEQGRAMHKSAGNAVAPDEVIKTYGADILRLWVLASDYQQDVRVSPGILKQLSEMYLKIRNTARFILGNLAGFTEEDELPFSELLEIDRFALHKLNELVKLARAAYDVYEFHTVTHGVHTFCAVFLSNFYLDVIKDRLYCDRADSRSGRSARTAVRHILSALTRLLAPILAFTPEEVWAAIPHTAAEDGESVLMNDMPAFDAALSMAEDDAAKWENLLRLRGVVNKALETARAEKLIGKSLDAEVTLFVTDAAEEKLSDVFCLDLKALLMTASVSVLPQDGREHGAPSEIDGVAVFVEASQKEKCLRCWNRDEDIDENGLCPRCAAALRQ
ncbi:MAG: isoleucine--tRNA ligase [Oscillospiraceae bacterium]|jgi:isoleucyl-tRNA synthetase|nr:isoleucine--tRNA ligase [Oscillospiraceae bacterium]